MFAISPEPIDMAAVTEAVADEQAGAVATFGGMTRAHNRGRRVIRLEYEAYDEMASIFMRLEALKALAKLDGTAKGGIVLAISVDLGLPVLYIGTGEQPEDLTPFEPRDFVEGLFAPLSPTP